MDTTKKIPNTKIKPHFVIQTCFSRFEDIKIRTKSQAEETYMYGNTKQ